jgi:hypothetical protein
MKTSPKVQVDTIPAGKFFAYTAELLELHPPHITDEPIIAVMKRIDIEVQKNFDVDKVGPAMKAALERVPQGAQQLMRWKVPTLAANLIHSKNSEDHLQTNNMQNCFEADGTPP